MNNKITIFTVEITDNHYLDHPVCQLCINSWSRLKNKIIEQGYDCEIKIFKSTDPEVVQFKKEYPMTTNPICLDKLSRLANAFRVYILSKYDNYIWLDSDIYILEDVEFNPCYWINRKVWNIMSNINNSYYFKKAWNLYKQIDYVQADYLMHQKLFGDIDIGKEVIHNYIHLAKLMIKDARIILIEEQADIDKIFSELSSTSNIKHTLVISNLSLILLIYFLKTSRPDLKKFYKIVDNCNDIKLLNFVKENYTNDK